MIELVDFNEIYGKGLDKAAEPAKKTRRGRAPKKADEAVAIAVTTVAEATIEDATLETPGLVKEEEKAAD